MFKDRIAHARMTIGKMRTTLVDDCEFDSSFAKSTWSSLLNKLSIEQSNKDLQVR